VGEVLDSLTADELGIDAEERAKRRRVLDKQSGQAFKTANAQKDHAVIEAQKAAIAPSQVIETRCHVCTHPNRLFIEQSLVNGYGHTKIADAIPDIEGVPKPDRRSIGKHLAKHMPLELQTIRKTLDEEAALLQQNVEDGARGAVTDRGMLKVLVRKAYELAQAGSIAIEMRDVIQMIKLLNDMDVKASTGRADEYERDFGLFLQAIRNVCDENTQRLISAEVKRLRSYDDVETEVEAALLQLPVEVVDAVIVEEPDEIQPTE